jgi:hypothetical protein
MSRFWQGYASVNDDIRHTYEQVFYGRQTTGNLTANDIPGMAVQASPVAADGPNSAGPGDTGSHDHSAFYGTIWGGDAPTADPSSPTSPGLGPTPGGAGTATIEAPKIEAPKIEAPEIAPPNQGNDMTPDV